MICEFITTDGWYFEFTKAILEACHWHLSLGESPCESLVLGKGNPLGLSGQLYLALKSPIYSALFH